MVSKLLLQIKTQHSAPPACVKKLSNIETVTYLPFVWFDMTCIFCF
uniref:Uncharacterized protein n=1 Tax=Populus trichocarpa TaxID=3694 RepID=A9P808_POPTR|nr:unknown [Populus trichocarpa]